MKRDNVPLQVWITPAMRDALQAMADQADRPLSREVRQALQAHLDRHAAQAPPPAPAPTPGRREKA